MRCRIARESTVSTTAATADCLTPASGAGPSSRWNAPYPEFAYSESRESTFRRCQRAYYHATYTSWRGWTAAPGSDAWLAYRCKKSTPLAAAIGSVVHEAATRCTHALVKHRRLPTFHELRREAGDALNAMWTNAHTRRHEYLRRPSGLPTPMLQEVLYREGPSPEALQRARAKLDRTLASLLECNEIWVQVLAADASAIIIPERFYQFSLPTDGTIVYAAPDLVIASQGNPPVIVDYKSSGADAVIDQILTYCVAARDGMKLDVQDGCVGQVVALDASPEERVSRFTVSPEEIVQASERIESNATAMRGYLTDVDLNRPKAMQAFAQARNTRTCRWCTYRALCWPDQHRIVI